MLRSICFGLTLTNTTLYLCLCYTALAPCLDTIACPQMESDLGQPLVHVSEGHGHLFCVQYG